MLSTVKTILLATGFAGAVLLGGTAAILISKYSNGRKYCIDSCNNEQTHEPEDRTMFQGGPRIGGDAQ